MKYLDITPTFHNVYNSTLNGTRYKFEMLWDSVNGWLVSIEKSGVSIVDGRALRQDVDLFDGLSEPVKIIPRFAEPTRTNINQECKLEVVYVV